MDRRSFLMAIPLVGVIGKALGQVPQVSEDLVIFTNKLHYPYYCDKVIENYPFFCWGQTFKEDYKVID